MVRIRNQFGLIAVAFAAATVASTAVAEDLPPLSQLEFDREAPKAQPAGAARPAGSPEGEPASRARLAEPTRIEVVTKPGLTVLNTSQLAGQRVDDEAAKLTILSGKDAIGVSDSRKVKSIQATTGRTSGATTEKSTERP